ncbi:MAG: DUF2332 domain-containing protein [Acidimicrobiia bacterium]
MRNQDMPDGGRIAERIRKFGEFVSEESPSYSRICLELAEDPTLARILGGAPHDQPVPNILLAGVQYLLLQGAAPDLATHYPSVVGADTQPKSDLVALFAEFCRAEEKPLSEIAATRTVQTNEVRRSIALMPAFAWVSQQSREPLALLEVGASAGLNLLFDRYRYDYGEGVVAGPPESKLTLVTELRSGLLPPIDPLPEVMWRRGIDLHPVILTDPDAVRWARALLWPEQLDRIRRFEAAVEIALSDPPDVVAGDALESLSDVAAAAPPDATLIVFHSYVLNQFSSEARDQLEQVIASLSMTRPVHRIGIDMTARDAHPEIRHTVYSGGETSERVLGFIHHHGAWLEWTA